MAPNAHRIRRESWRLQVASATAAFTARARLRAEVEDLLPVFNAAFDDWAPDEAILRIPRLELRLRIASLAELPEALGDALRRETPLQSSVPCSTASASAENRAVLLRYLETGVLEWHAAQAEPVEAAGRLRTTLLAELGTVMLSTPAEPVPFERALQCYVRLLQLLPEEKWCDAANVLASSESRRSIGPSGEPRTGVGAASVPRRPGEAFVAAIVEIVSTRVRLGRSAAVALAAAGFATARSGPRSREALRADLSRLLDVDALGAAPREAAQFLDAESPGQAPAALRTSPAPAERARPSESTPPQVASLALAVVAANAGIVLLHPFLPALFEECGLYSPRRGLEPASLPRAAALLHWLACGRDEIHEFELGAVKVFLGLRPETSLPATAGPPGERERDEGTAMLHAAIDHWKVLKGTSIDGFRVSFLQRRGTLRMDEAGWHLQVETESFDVLLKHLPWGIATVKLPWMTQPLFTDWATS